jgi:DNA replication protein DnaC
MERLNDIMNRTAQRRQQAHNGQSGTSAASQGQHPRPLTTRRPLPEQTARLDQPRGNIQPLPPHQQQAQSSSQRLPTQPGQRPPTPGERNVPRQYGYQYRQPYNEANRGGETAPASRPVYPPQPQPQPQPRAQYREQRYTGDDQYAPPMPMPGDYYESYPARPQADVQETWDEEGAGMIYGDWEGEEESGGASYAQEPMANSVPLSPYAQWSTASALARQNRDPLLTRQLSASQHYGYEQEAVSPFSDPAHLPAVQPGRERERNAQSVQRPPLPSPSYPPTQETRPVYRNTQPLNPRTAARMHGNANQNRPTPEVPHMQQPARQAVVPEQEKPIIPPPLVHKDVCSKCHGAGYLRLDVPVGHPNFGKPVPCECKEAEWKEKRRQELFELSDLSTFEDKGFGNFMRRFSGSHPSVEQAYQAACTFAQEPDGWLLLVGPNGCGKTHLAVAIANYCLRDGAVVLFSVVPDLLAHLRATFSPSATEAYDQRFAKMREAELLVLDDLGAHQSSPWASEKLFQLLNYRYNARFPTIITANRKGLDSVDERIYSRLSDTALVTKVAMDGAGDYRLHNPRRELKR